MSNYSIGQIDDLIQRGGEQPAVNQIPWSPSRSDAGLLAAHADRGVALEGYSPLKGTLAARPHAGRDRRQVRCHPRPGRPGAGTSTSASSSSPLRPPQRIEQNFDIFGFSLTPEQSCLSRPLDCPPRICAAPGFMASERSAVRAVPWVRGVVRLPYPVAPTSPVRDLGLVPRRERASIIPHQLANGKWLSTGDVPRRRYPQGSARPAPDARVRHAPPRRRRLAGEPKEDEMNQGAYVTLVGYVVENRAFAPPKPARSSPNCASASRPLP